MAVRRDAAAGCISARHGAAQPGPYEHDPRYRLREGGDGLPDGGRQPYRLFLRAWAYAVPRSRARRFQRIRFRQALPGLARGLAAARRMEGFLRRNTAAPLRVRQVVDHAAYWPHLSFAALSDQGPVLCEEAGSAAEYVRVGAIDAIAAGELHSFLPGPGCGGSGRHGVL